MHFLPSEYLDEYESGVYSEQAKKYIYSIYGNQLLGDAEPNLSNYGLFYKDLLVDETTLYRHNEFAYRSDFWDGSHEILALGCSNTYGSGIPEEGRWTDILQELSNKKVANLSSSGQSINFLISQAFAYFKLFGNPEYVICLFPDPLRVNLPTNRKLLDSKNTNDKINRVVYLDSSANTDDRPKYLKKPYYYEDILPLEFSIFLSMQSIYALEQYCNSNKIKLIWSTWEPVFQNFISSLSEISLNNFVNKDSLTIQGSYLYDECHSEYRERFEYYFVHGRDGKDVGLIHPGVHKNIHIAESFYEELKKLS
jgi:hypothetical protein